MADQVAKRDDNRIPTLLGVTDDASAELRRLLVDPTTGRLLVSAVISSDLTDLGDVSFTSIAAGDIMYYNGTNWVNLAIGSPTNVLTVNGAGTAPEWSAAGAGANTALSNLASVAINTTLVSDTDNTDDLGTTAKRWKDVYAVTFKSPTGGIYTPSVIDTSGHHQFTSGQTLNSSSGTDIFFSITGTINQTGTAATDFIQVNVTSTAVGSGAQNFINFKDDTNSMFSVSLAGLVTAANLALGTGGITMTGSLAATGARVTKGWFTDIESTNMPTVGGTAILTSLTAPQFTTIELGHATENTLSAASGVLSIEGTAIPKGTGTSNEIAYWSGTNTLGTLAVATYPSLTELSYVKGVTSAIQTQLAAMLPLAGGTMSGNITLGENTSIALDPAGSADGKYSGITVTGLAGYSQAFGDLVTLDKDDSRWEAVDISAAAAATGDARGILGIVVSAGTDGNACTILLHGIVRADANFPTLTIGAPVYASTTGDVVVAQPTTTDYVIRIVGYALTADELYFNPGNTWTTHT